LASTTESQFEKENEMSTLTKVTKVARHWVWIAPIALGIAFFAGGAYMVVEGRNAHNDVRDTITQEQITVSADAPAYGGEIIDSAAKADAQSDAILHHTLAGSGGYLYAQQGSYLLPSGTYMLPAGTYMTEAGGTTQDKALAATDAKGNPIMTTTDKTLAAKDANGNPVANPLRNTALTSAELRTSLGVAVMGFKISDLVVGLGAFLIVLGLMNVFIMAPVTYWATVVADEHEKKAAKQTATAVAGQTA
jgi:hypothetical protein